MMIYQTDNSPFSEGLPIHLCTFGPITAFCYLPLHPTNFQDKTR